jgi:ferredoxin-thioredoxin reductase catalytic subunit
VIQSGAREQVADAHGYELDDADERSWVAWLVEGIVAQIADLGARTAPR